MSVKEMKIGTISMPDDLAVFIKIKKNFTQNSPLSGF